MLSAPIPETYLRVAELWRCDDQEQVLLHAGGYYSNHTAFSEVSRQLSFPMGLGLIGRCARQGSPILLDAMSPDSGFLRSVAAQREGLTLGLALPVNDRSGRKSVLALFFAVARGQSSGGVEVWAESGTSGDLGLAFAHHGIAEDFRRMTSLFRFQMGEGLPGRSAQHRAPEFLSLAEPSGEFLRAAAAETSGFVHAVGFPGLGAAGTAIVLLGHREQPLARQIEIWSRDRGGALERTSQRTELAAENTIFDCLPLLMQAEKEHAPVPFTISNPDSLDLPLGGVIIPFDLAELGFRACMFLW